jgi:hypothetical protein
MGDFQAVLLRDENGVIREAIPLPSTVLKATKYEDLGTSAPFDKDVKGGSGLWAIWGDDDNYPASLREKMSKCDIAGATIGKLSELMWGDGIFWSKDWNQDHKQGVSKKINDEIEDFFDRNEIETNWYPGQISDYRLHMNTFTEFWWDDKGQKIAGMEHKSAEHCRLAYQDESTGRIPHVIYSPDFGLGNTPIESRRKKILNFDRRVVDPIEVVRGKNFIHHAYYPTPGMTYYASPFWSGLFKKDGWVDASILIPGTVTRYNRNRMKIAYQINIPTSYFIARDPDFETYDAKKRIEIFQKEVARIDSILKDERNEYVTITSMFMEAIGTNDPYGKIEILPIKSESITSTWMPDSNVSDAKIVQGLGLHPSQMGLSPEGGKMGAGSGSDQQESFNTARFLSNVHHQIILFRLNSIVSLVNKWGVKFWNGGERHVTKNVNKSGVINEETGVTKEK